MGHYRTVKIIIRVNMLIELPPQLTLMVCEMPNPLSCGKLFVFSPCQCLRGFLNKWCRSSVSVVKVSFMILNIVSTSSVAVVKSVRLFRNQFVGHQ